MIHDAGKNGLAVSAGGETADNGDHWQPFTSLCLLTPSVKNNEYEQETIH